MEDKSNDKYVTWEDMAEEESPKVSGNFLGIFGLFFPEFGENASQKCQNADQRFFSEYLEDFDTDFSKVVGRAMDRIIHHTLVCCSDRCLFHFSKNEILQHLETLLHLNMKEKIGRWKAAFEHCLIDHRNKTLFVFQSKFICAEAFRLIYGCSDYMFRKLKKGEEHLPHGNTGKTHKSPIYLQCKQWLSDLFAKICNTYGPAEWHAPIYTRKANIYLDMMEELKLSGTSFSTNQFYSMLGAEFPFVKFPKFTKIGRCDECIELNNLLGTATGNERIRLKSLQDDHNKLHSTEREHYMQRCSKAKADKNEMLHLVIDAMSHFYVPSLNPEPKGWQSLSRLECHLTGIKNHSLDATTFFISPNFWGEGSNITCSILFKHFSDCAAAKWLPNKLWVQFDNTCKDNKNQFIFGFMGLLLAMSVFVEINICCLPPGHTHCDIDQAFVPFKKAYEKEGLSSLLHIEEFVTRHHPHQSPNVQVITAIYDWKGFLEPLLVSMKYYSHQRYFKFVIWENEPCYWYKPCEDHHWIGQQNGTDSPIKLFKDSLDKDIGFPSLVAAKAVDPVVLSSISSEKCLGKLTVEHCKWLQDFSKNPTPIYLGLPWKFSWDCLRFFKEDPIKENGGVPVGEIAVETEESEQILTSLEIGSKVAMLTSRKPPKYIIGEILESNHTTYKVQLFSMSSEDGIEKWVPQSTVLEIPSNAVLIHSFVLTKKKTLKKVDERKIQGRVSKFLGPCVSDAKKGDKIGTKTH